MDLCEAHTAYYSLNPGLYDSVRNIANAVEQTQHKSYWMGRYTTLLGVVMGQVKIMFLTCSQLLRFDDYNLMYLPE